MAKRVRGTSIRPGQRTPLQRAAARQAASPIPPVAAAAAPKPTGLTADEEARAAVIEARIVAEEKAADEARRRTTERRRIPDLADGRVVGGIAIRAAEEYAYVGRDVRRIALLGGSLITLLLVLWVIAQAIGASPV